MNLHSKSTPEPPCTKGEKKHFFFFFREGPWGFLSLFLGSFDSVFLPGIKNNKYIKTPDHPWNLLVLGTTDLFTPHIHIYTPIHDKYLATYWTSGWKSRSKTNKCIFSQPECIWKIELNKCEDLEKSRDWMTASGIEWHWKIKRSQESKEKMCRQTGLSVLYGQSNKPF